MSSHADSVQNVRFSGWAIREAPYAHQLDEIQDPLELAERGLLLTVLLEPALLALRRMAQQNESARRHADAKDN